MKVRNIKTKEKGESSSFNTHSLSEVIVGWKEELDTVFTKDLEVFIEALQVWKTLNQAFKDKDIINDNYNEYFFEPKNEEDRKRGYTL